MSFGKGNLFAWKITEVIRLFQMKIDTSETEYNLLQ